MIGRLILMVIIVGTMMAAGCQRLGLPETSLPDDGPPIAVSPAAALRFIQKVTAAGQQAVTTGSSTLSVTQEEVTSFIVIGAQLAEAGQGLQTLEGVEGIQQLQGVEGLEGAQGLDELQRLAEAREGLPALGLPDLSLRLALRDPRVYFKDNGQIVIRGYGELRGRRQPIRVVVAPRAAGGELVLDFVEGTIGPVGMPEVLFDQIGGGIGRILLAGQEYAEITALQVGNGVLTISGRRNK